MTKRKSIRKSGILNSGSEKVETGGLKSRKIKIIKQCNGMVIEEGKHKNPKR